MRSSTRVLLLCLVGTAFEGCLCNGPSPAPAPPAAQTPDPAAAAELARRVCDVLQREPARRRAACCGGGDTRHFADACERVLGAALGAGRLEIESASLDACVDASSREPTGCDWVTPGQPLPPPACQGLTRGKVGAGGGCRSSLECAGALHCEGQTPSEAGHCAPPEALGSACGAGSDALATYLFAAELERTHPTCAGECSLVTRRCEAAAPERVPPTARAQAVAGEACQTDFDCASGGCSGGRCGMKCSIELGLQPPATLPALAFRRRAVR